MKIKLLQQDLDEGGVKSDNCPLQKALSREYPGQPCWVGCVYFLVGNDIYQHLSVEAKAFISKWDTKKSRKDFKPMEIEL